MNVYFACSITGGRDFESVYQAITQAMLADGHQVPTAHLADPGVKVLESVASPSEVYERDVAWLRACNALVAEVSTPSHGVGYEVAFALSIGKTVLCIAREGRPVSKMLTGNTHANIRVETYRDAQEAVAKVRDYLSRLQTNL